MFLPLPAVSHRFTSDTVRRVPSGNPAGLSCYFVVAILRVVGTLGMSKPCLHADGRDQAVERFLRSPYFIRV